MTHLSAPQRMRLRKFFGDSRRAGHMPNLIEVQKSSYAGFLQLAKPKKGKREEIGLQAALGGAFPIENYQGNAELHFLDYQFDDPKYDVEECRHRGMTYEAAIKLTLRLIVFDIDEKTGAKTMKNSKEQSVYMGDLPLMTDNGTFVVNGAERVVVSQMHRSPGVFFDHDKGKTHSSGKFLFAARIIPYRGSWMDFEFDAKDVLHARMDRRRKIPATVLLYALGMEKEEILRAFHGTLSYKRAANGWRMMASPDSLRGLRVPHDLHDSEGTRLVEAGEKITGRISRLLSEKGKKGLFALWESMRDRYLASAVVHSDTGEILAAAGAEIDAELSQKFQESGVKNFDVLDVESLGKAYIRATLEADKCQNQEEALQEVYRVMRPGDTPTAEAAKKMFQDLFFNKERYDLSAAGRVKMNIRLNLDAPDDMGTLRKDDILAVMRTLIDLRDGKGEVDDIDNLGNRRVRSVGELMENQYRMGLARMQRAVRERMNQVEIDNIMPQDLINAKTVTAMVKEFFGSSQLSQFMDQTNPLSEVTHKRRISALGPGGLTRERAGFQVRDVHPTHYGRICPVETPEGPNIGLINSLATYARINQYGLIESAYCRVKNARVTEEIVYLSAIEENRYHIAQASIALDDKKRITEESINCRFNGGFETVSPEKVDLIDVSPRQIVSIAAALIPFLENDDANRALMGSNMQRQAVPLLKSQAPLVGTGMESVVARDSGAAVVARRSGVVDQVDAKRIFIRATESLDPSDPGVDIYNLRKFQRSNQSTCINQITLVHRGQRVEKGEIIADGQAIDHGELALGRNVLAAFMPWHGYNFEDSILISERLVIDDTFTSIHIEEFEAACRDTKLGPEEITRDVPNAGEEALRHLDEVGIAYIGAQVQAGDILIGKTTPKSEMPMTPEERLLRSIFGEKASEVRDTSLRLPPGASGTVVEVRIFNRHGVEKDERALSVERHGVDRLARDRDDELAVLSRNVYQRLHELLLNKQAVINKRPARITDAMLDETPRHQWWDISLKSDPAMREVETLRASFDEGRKRLEDIFNAKSGKLQQGDDLPPGVMKVVKVFVAVKRKIQQGDKMAGRHGNKGVVSKILPIEDMPHLEDGTPVDIVLNPLGVPSRMNVGQILETHLGWACAGMGQQIGRALQAYRDSNDSKDLKEKIADLYQDQKISSLSDDNAAAIGDILSEGVPVAGPVFEGVQEKEIAELLKNAELDPSGQVTLYDGRTGDPFARDVTVGYIYMLKLHHLVDEKIHARSVGPYSLVTQQPLGGKAQFGGQRFGEMEVWALEAYGACYTLQEMLTIKSDDVAGRTKAYEQIVQGGDTFSAGIPESFNVLMMEMRALGLNVESPRAQPVAPALPEVQE